MGNLQSWSMLLGVLVGLAVVSYLGLALMLLILLSRAAWRGSALRGGFIGVCLAIVASFVGLFLLMMAAEEGSVPKGYSPLHGGVTTITLLLMAVVFPSVSLLFSLGAGIGYLFHRPRRRQPPVLERADD